MTKKDILAVFSLIAVFFVAVFLRCLMPVYLMKTNQPYDQYNLAGGPAPLIVALSISLAKNEGITFNYKTSIKNELKNLKKSNSKNKEIKNIDYSLKSIVNDLGKSGRFLDSIPKKNIDQKYALSSGLGPILVMTGIMKAMNSINIPCIQIIQGIIDSVGCLLVYGILIVFFQRRVAVIGSLLYAICPAFIFYSYHFNGEMYVPVLMLAIGYAVICGIQKDKPYLFAIAGGIMGVALGFRFDNVLIWPLYLCFIFYFYRKFPQKALIRAGLLFFCCIFAYLPLKVTNPTNIIGLPLYANLGEYPAHFKGLRFGSVGTVHEYGMKKAHEYLEHDVIFKSIDSFSRNYLTWLTNPDSDNFLITTAFVREVIIAKPFLYADRLLTRFVVYLPSHPFTATIAYFLSTKNKSTWNYPYSQIFNSVKYVDYALFIVFLYGIWCYRRNDVLLSLLCIYFGVHIGHVVLGNGDINYIREKEYYLINPRYLIGMISIWPIFIAISVGELLKKLSWDNVFSSKIPDTLKN